jgi:GDP/UDP-N,N'-diacetylbacillosamine 2-epimerase (hydrolysing)
MIRKICVVTGSRAEYGLLRWIMTTIDNTPGLQLQIIATGMHLSPEFGLTFREIEGDGFTIDRKVEMLINADTASSTAKSMGLGMIGFSDALKELQPDLLLVLGDRFEIFSAVAAALVAAIPVGHIHGGEVTEGAFDESIRHAITKMSHIHFVAADEYRNRVIQMGEQPTRVFTVGGLGVDAIKKVQLLERSELEAALQFSFGPRNLLVTFHPVTLEKDVSLAQGIAMLDALGELKDTNLIFTLPNADAGNYALSSAIKEFVAQRNNACVFASLGQLRYLSCLQYVDGVVGNSSSGLLEAPSFGKATINIGNRQQGRLKSSSVIDCDGTKQSILHGLHRMYSDEFRKSLVTAVNPYGDGGASTRIVEILSDFPFDNFIKKPFYDLVH